MECVATEQERLVSAVGEASASVGKVLGAGTVAVTEIIGGRARNIIPDRCELSVGRRTVDGEDPMVEFDRLSEMVRSAALPARRVRHSGEPSILSRLLYLRSLVAMRFHDDDVQDSIRDTLSELLNKMIGYDELDKTTKDRIKLYQRGLALYDADCPLSLFEKVAIAQIHLIEADVLAFGDIVDLELDTYDPDQFDRGGYPGGLIYYGDVPDEDLDCPPGARNS